MNELRKWFDAFIIVAGTLVFFGGVILINLLIYYGIGHYPIITGIVFFFGFVIATRYMLGK